MLVEALRILGLRQAILFGIDNSFRPRLENCQSLQGEIEKFRLRSPSENRQDRFLQAKGSVTLGCDKNALHHELEAISVPDRRTVNFSEARAWSGPHLKMDT